MNFQERLAAKKKSIESNLAPSYVKVLHSSTKQLEKSGIRKQVLKRGASMPSFELKNQNGRVIKSSELLDQGPLVLTFYRGFWCPYCNIDLANMKKYVNEISELGATLLAVSPEKEMYSKKIIAMQKLNFDIVWDKHNELAKEFGLKYFIPKDLKELYRDKLGFNLKVYHGDDEWALPLPSRFVIDSTGVIRYAESSSDYTQRPDPDDLMHILKTLN